MDFTRNFSLNHLRMLPRIDLVFFYIFLSKLFQAFLGIFFLVFIIVPLVIFPVILIELPPKRTLPKIHRGVLQGNLTECSFNGLSKNCFKDSFLNCSRDFPGILPEFLPRMFLRILFGTVSGISLESIHQIVSGILPEISLALLPWNSHRVPKGIRPGDFPEFLLDFL